MANSGIRMLQLVDLDAGFQACRGAELLARDAGAGFTIITLTIGRGGNYPSLLRAVTRLRRDLDQTPHLTHTSGSRALTAAAMSQRGPIVHAPEDVPSRRSLRWVRSVMHYRDVQVIAPSATLRRACLERIGVPLDRCHLIRPGVEFARIRRRRDPQLRAALGFEDSDRVMLLAGES